MSTQFIILLIFGGISMLSWVLGKLREQAELKRARDEARRRREEELRTGRSGDAPDSMDARQTAARTRAQELAARRQAQLEQLRRQQQARAQVTLPGGVVIVRNPPPPPAPTRAPSPARRPPSPAGPTGIPVPPRRSTVRPTPASRGAPGPRPTPPTAAPPPRAPAPRPAPPRVEAPDFFDRDNSRRGRQGPSVRDLLRGSAGAPAGAGNLRALIGAMEVLGPPVALRRTERLL